MQKLQTQTLTLVLVSFSTVPLSKGVLLVLLIYPLKIQLVLTTLLTEDKLINECNKCL